MAFSNHDMARWFVHMETIKGKYEREEKEGKRKSAVGILTLQWCDCEVKGVILHGKLLFAGQKSDQKILEWY